MTESSEINSKTDNLAITGESDVYESIPIHLQKERKHTSMYETMKIDIEKISTFERETNYIQLNGGKYTKL